MSFFPGKDPAAGDRYACDALETVVVPRSVDLDGFSVRRALPHTLRRTIGPFVFFDHFGPAEFKSGQGIDVRPHPHIGLSTLTTFMTARSFIATISASGRRSIRARSTG
jgi:redox-sensitive bicupin YhaK (pirin superfamily)